jgi:hypothetical protein
MLHCWSAHEGCLKLAQSINTYTQLLYPQTTSSLPRHHAYCTISDTSAIVLIDPDVY